jgi:hypothetical protein
VRHVVNFSGGLCSWACAKRVVERHGTEETTLLFADTKMEDGDLYRFIHEAAEDVGRPLVKIADGRTPWEVFEDEKMIGSSRFDPCSKKLKRELLDRWHRQNRDPKDTVIHFGLTWNEGHRLARLRERKAPWRVEAYLTDPPYLERRGMLEMLEKSGIKPPRLYALGFPHNNCGGFCIKAGQAQFALLLKTMPDRYAFHEANENRLRQKLGWRHTILRRQVNGTIESLSLSQLRKEIEAQMSFDELDWGGCGCAVE